MKRSIVEALFITSVPCLATDAERAEVNSILSDLTEN